MAVDHLARHRGFAVTALLGGKIDDNAAGAHGLDHTVGNQLGGWFAGNQRGRDDHVDLVGLAREQRHFSLDEFLAHDLGVAALAGAVFLEIELEKFGIHTQDLVLDLGSGVEGAYDRAKRFGSTDRGQSGNTGADDQYLGGIHLAGRGYLT